MENVTRRVLVITVLDKDIPDESRMDASKYELGSGAYVFESDINKVIQGEGSLVYVYFVGAGLVGMIDSRVMSDIYNHTVIRGTSLQKKALRDLDIGCKFYTIQPSAKRNWFKRLLKLK
jgi:hypothetical protein